MTVHNVYADMKDGRMVLLYSSISESVAVKLVILLNSKNVGMASVNVGVADYIYTAIFGKWISIVY